MSDTLTLIRETLNEVLKDDVGPISRDTDIARDLDLDSILFVQFLLALEEVVPGLEFTQETLGAATLTDVGSLVDFVDGTKLVAAE